MYLLLSIVIHTANILGIFSDPFEFEGDYGQEVNSTRNQVFELLVSPEAIAKNLSDAEIRTLIGNPEASEKEVFEYKHDLITKAVADERNLRPTLSQLVSPLLIDEMKLQQEHLKESGFTDPAFTAIVAFLERHQDQKVFHFLRNHPPELLHLDKALRDQAAREGKGFELPIIGSTQFLEESDPLELKKHLIKAVFTKETFALTKPQKNIEEALAKLSDDYLKQFFGQDANPHELNIFSTPVGQVFFYWMYHALNLELIAKHPGLIEQVNHVKHQFASTLGDPLARAEIFKEKLMDSNSEVLFTQECDAKLIDALTKEGLFLPVDSQNPQDGTLVFLRSDQWEPDYAVIPIEGYEGFTAGRMNVILAARKDSGQLFLLASCHGKSTKAEDGRLQIQLIMEKFHELSNGNLQLFIGIDANTKTDKDVELLRQHLNGLGLMSTQTGPTTIKKRMVTAQHTKAAKMAIDEEDYLITLKPERGGLFQFSHETLGFKEERADTSQSLPNIYNPSDHYPVGSVMVPVQQE